MKTERFGILSAVFLILVKDGKVLLGRRTKGSNWYDGYYDLPAGHLEKDESTTSAVRREAKEEIGVDINPHDINFVCLFHRYYPEDQRVYYNIFFEVSNWEGKPGIMEPDKCDDLQWFDLDNLPENLTPSTKDGLKAYVDKARFIEAGFPG
jgi:8-oxo-dGTP pyrophosphatase MutT (NUDIX family)